MMTLRVIRLYIRDRQTVLFSFLSAFIVVALFVLFLGKAIIGDMMTALRGTFQEEKLLYLTYLQMMAGILGMNSISLSSGAFTTIARDFEERRSDSFLLTPMTAWELVVSYFFGGVFVAYGMSIFSWILSYTMIGALTGYWLALLPFLQICGVLLPVCFVSSAIILLFAALVKSSSAIGVFTGVAGTVVGFLSGIYISFKTLGEGVEKAGSLLPFTHFIIWMKQLVLVPAAEQVELPASVLELMYDEFSANPVGILGLNVPLWGTLLCGGAAAVLCLGLAAWLLQKRLAVK
jgi:multidrug/hemolysin transport system permease protein